MRGIVWLTIGLAASTVMLVRRVPTGWYVALLVPFTAAAIYWFQAHEKT